MAPTLTVLAGAVALLMLIACVNLASLLLNKSAARAHEFSIRAAIGGSRGTLVRQLLIEQALLVVIGGVLGALAGAAILTGLVSVAPRRHATSRRDSSGPRRAVVDDAGCCACAFLFGVVPALKASGHRGPGARHPIRPRFDAAVSFAAPRPDDGGDRGRDGAALRSRTDGPHDAPAGARRSRLRSPQPADVHVLAGGAAVAGRQESRRSSPKRSSGSERCPGSRTPRSRIRSRSSARTGGTGSRWPADPSRRAPS